MCLPVAAKNALVVGLSLVAISPNSLEIHNEGIALRRTEYTHSILDNSYSTPAQYFPCNANLYDSYFTPEIIDSAICNDNNTIDMPVKLIYVPEFSL